jgi:hypothetical protein
MYSTFDDAVTSPGMLNELSLNDAYMKIGGFSKSERSKAYTYRKVSVADGVSVYYRI